MSIFDNLIQVDGDGNLVYNKWVEWEHFGVTNESGSLRAIIRCFLAILGHCLTCTSLAGCYFIERNMPEQPLHINCDFNKRIISHSQVKSMASANMDIDKLNKYIFSENSKGKKELFQEMGFSKEDAYNLKLDFETQALTQYLNGNYTIKGLDAFGQRLAIKITLNGFSFYSGWMVEPGGLIRNITPFGGWIK